MSDLPARVHIHEEGPREGFQIEKAPIATSDKIRFIEALAEAGCSEIACVSFVNPRKVPGMADAEQVASGLRRRPGTRYTGLFLNRRGLDRALASGIDVEGAIRVSASETFARANTGMGLEETLAEQRQYLRVYRERRIRVDFGYVMTAFGCNYEGFTPIDRVVEMVQCLVEVAASEGEHLRGIYLADTVGWATPAHIERAVGEVRSRWPQFEIGLHLHDTRGTGLANAYAGMRMGVSRLDSSCAGLGGCPFTGSAGSAGNICTEDLVFMCEETGIETGIDLEKLIECGHLAEKLVGHALPGKLLRSGSLQRFKHVA